MDKGSSSVGESRRQRRGGEQAPVRPKVEPFVPERGHCPDELKSWAKRTGFVSTFSSEISNGSVTETDGRSNLNLRKTELDPVLGRGRGSLVENGRKVAKFEIDSDIGAGKRQNIRDGNVDGHYGGGNMNRRIGAELKINSPAEVEMKEDKKDLGETAVNVSLNCGQGGPEEMQSSSRVKCGLKENPGFAIATFYGLQHYLSLAGSQVFMPLLMVPAMGGTDKDIAMVISTMLMVSGFTTLLHSFFGTRLPLVQGSSFVYLAPALVVANSLDNRNLMEHRFRHTMRELQGAIVVGSLFQSILGLTGSMSLLLRLINPIVVAPTVAAVGLSYFSFGFPQAGNCVELGVPQLVLVLVFSLYLRGVSIFGHRVFRVYSVLLSFLIIWVYAFILTASGAYDYKGCSTDIPNSNILVDACRKHAYTMRQCRTDVSNAWRTADWVRVPYPLQWGVPIFYLRTCIIMTVVSLIASVDSVGTYHSVSVRISSRPPTPCIVSRGVCMEGLCSILAGLWGTGTGSTTLTENIHTIDATKIANRRAVQLGAAFLIVFSVIGKVGAVLASIPLAVAASVLCFIWSLIVALGLMNLQYCQTSSLRNLTIVGVSLFLGLSVPTYFQQYQPDTTLVLPGYLVPYAAASSGPVKFRMEQVNFILNGLLSMNMVVTFLVAFVLDNTVPGTRQERGTYVWSRADNLAYDPEHLADYSLPSKFTFNGLCCWARGQQPQLAQQRAHLSDIGSLQQDNPTGRD